MNAHYAGSFLVAFTAVLALIPLVKKWALRIGFLDVPAGVKDHRKPIPLGGGLAVCAGSIVFVQMLMIALGLKYSPSAIGLIAGSVIVVLIGLYDDYYEMGAFDKILGQFVCIFIFLFFAEKQPPVLSLPAYYLLSTVWILGIMNAINYIDNLDGLCGGVSLTIAAGFGILFVLKEMPIFAIVSFGLAGGALGFLRYNLTPASIFLGDGGSLLFGFALSCLGIVYFNTSKSLTAALSPILIMAFPIFDMTLVTIARLNKGRKVYVASKDHAWDMIRILGYSKEVTVYLIWAINFALVASGVAIYFMGESPMQVFLVFAFGLLLAFIGSQLYRNFLYIKESVGSLLIDLFAVNLSFILYLYIRYYSGLFGAYQPVSVDTMAIPLAWINGFWIILYTAMGLYDISFETRFIDQISILLKTTLTGGAIFLLANYDPETGFQISLVYIMMYLGILFVTAILLRWFLYLYFTARMNRSLNKPNLLIVKPGRSGFSAHELDQIRNKYNLIGTVGDGTPAEFQNLGGVNELFDIVKNTKTARIVLDLQPDDYSDLIDIFSSAYFLETVFLAHCKTRKNLRGLRFRNTNVENILSVSIKHRSLFQLFIRRILDSSIAIIVLILASPIFLSRIVLSKIKRIPLLNTTDFIIRGEKLMQVKRWNTIGGNSGFHCVPMMLSVLKGQICIYGVTLTKIDEYKSSLNVIPGYWKKFLVKPGLFGPGYRGKTPLERFRLDLAYMEKTSTLGDFWMIFKQMLGISPLKIEDPKDA
jgi:UDP-GlcNAc:undecaprenyl-phosphate GlcNAc-1-phosphate transferase